MKTTLTHIENIGNGDIIIHNGNIKTVGYNNITFDTFMGRCLFGDSYSLGYKPVIKVTSLN